MKEIWNQRYSGEEFVYGEDPNEYLKAKLVGCQPGKILFPAEGEGRNAVFAAKMGWDVDAFDQSEAGKVKADLLAQRNHVAMGYVVSSMDDISYPENSFDALALIYAHFPSDKRRVYHQKLSAYLKKGGILILEGFEKKHTKNQELNPHAGGPKDAAMLYRLEEIKADFGGFEFMEADEVETTLSEGKYHLGEADVVRIYAIKK